MWKIYGRIFTAMSNGPLRNRFAYVIGSFGSPDRLSWWGISRTISSIILQVVAVYFIAVAGLGIWSGYDGKREAYHQEKQRADREQDQASRNIAAKCSVPDAPVDIVTECLAAEMEAYQDRQNTDQDLQAQQDMAYWAFLMFVASALSLPVSIGGLLLLLRSLRQTERAISTDREVGHAQVRAYVSIEPSVIGEIKVGGIIEGDLKFSNTGQSPAYKVRYVARIFIEDESFSETESDIIAAIPDENKLGSIIPANGSIEGDAASDAPLTRDDIEAVMVSGSKRVYLVCVVTYHDVFGLEKGSSERRTRFCAYLKREGQLAMTSAEGRTATVFGWSLTGPHNDAT